MGRGRRHSSMGRGRRQRGAVLIHIHSYVPWGARGRGKLGVHVLRGTCSGWCIGCVDQSLSNALLAGGVQQNRRRAAMLL